MSKPVIDIDSILNEILSAIESATPDRRHKGYTTLHKHAELLRGKLSNDQIDRLLKAFGKETADFVRNRAAEALGKVFVVAPVERTVETELAAEPSVEENSLSKQARTPKAKRGKDAAPPTKKEPSSPKKHLGTWLFEPFREKSAVISVYAKDKFRRDEPAEVYLGRRLSYDQNRHTQFLHFLSSDPEAHKWLTTQLFRAVCVVGRPGLFGKDLFLPLIRYPKSSGNADNPLEKSLRFGFDVHDRSPQLAPAELDPSYHSLIERKGDESLESWRTVDDGVSRCDYGLVQRYAVDIGGQKTVILVIAGASSLGTLGAAQWAADTLFPNPNDPSSEANAILVPDETRSAEQMEALVRVTADSRRGAWESPLVDLLHLSVDNQCWSPSDRRWLPMPPDEITLCYRADKPHRVLFNRRPHAFGKNSKMFVLMRALADSACQGRSEWLLDDLCENKAAWEDVSSDKVVTAEYAAEQLRTLRNRHLGLALAIDGDQTSLRCKVRRLDEP